MEDKIDFDEFEVINSIVKENYSIVDIYLQLKDVYDDIPWQELENRGLIEKGKTISSLASLLPYIDFSDESRRLFRKADGSSDIAAQLWLAEIKLKAQALELEEKNINSFNQGSINKKFLTSIAQMSKEVNSIANIKDVLKESGVILIYSPTLPKAKVDGAIGLLPSNTPFIGLSLRYHRLDSFWFTLLHELSHLCLHYDLLSQPIIDDFEDDTHDTNELEIEANYLTLESIVPRRIWNRSEPVFDPIANDEVIIKFANEVGVHPALIAGRLQKEKNRFDRYRKIVDEINVREILWSNP